MNEAISRLDQMTGITMRFMGTMTVLMITIVLGLIIGLFGLKLVRVWAAFIGFILGAAAGGAIASVAQLSEMSSVGAVLGAAVLLAILACIFYKVGIFFFMVFMVTGICIIVTGANSLPIVGISLVLGIVVAVVTVKVFDPLVIIVTSIDGGLVAGKALVTLIGLENNFIAVLAIPLVLIAVCVCTQFIMRSRQVGKKQAAKADEHRQQVSRENDVEQARKLLDDNDLDMDYDEDEPDEELDVEDYYFDEDDDQDESVDEEDYPDDLYDDELDDDFKLVE